MIISVVTISFNDLAGLRKTRASLESQILHDGLSVEHIVVDGGSSDGTVEFLSGKSGIHWISEPDRGRYDAMNKGLARAVGDFVWLMHAGDTFGGDASLVTAARAMESSPTGWGYGLARKVDGESCVGIFGNVPFDLRRFALGGRPIPHQATIVSRSVLDNVGDYDLSHGLAADQLYLLKCALVSEPVVIAEFLCNFDVTGAGSTRPAHLHYVDMRRAANRCHYSPTGKRLLDLAISFALQTLAVVKRRAARADTLK